MLYPTPIAKLIDSYSKLPGIGIKTATRLAFYTIGMEDDVVNEFAKNLLAAKRDLSYCSICGNLTDQDPCAICQDSTRDQSTILIVEDSRDVTALENIQEYHGLYHVLHGLISPMNGIGPDDINLKSLLTRLMDNEVTEVIVATNATADGEATSMYISRVLKPAGIKVTRLARGLAVGSDIEYADEVTLLRAIENRTELQTNGWLTHNHSNLPQVNFEWLKYAILIEKILTQEGLNMSKETLILLYGGRSAEREVSVLSAESVMRAINYDNFFVKTYFISQTGDFIKTQEFSQTPSADEKLMTNATIIEEQKIRPSDVYEEKAVVFPVLHGPMGEDGSIQGFLEVLRMPYVGTNILSSSVAMDKITTKRVLESAGIAQVPYVAVIEGENIAEKIAEIEEKLTYPVFVKPANMGSSVGISKAEDLAGLHAALDLAFKYDSRILVEQGVNAREVEVGLLGNADVKTTLPGEVVKDVAFYDYDAKYIDNKITMDIPAQIDESIMAIMRENAAKAFRAIGGCGLSRCDFFLTEDGDIFLNELNTMPGFTQWSMYPLLWDNMGLPYPDLIEELVRLAKEMFEKRESHLI